MKYPLNENGHVEGCPCKTCPQPDPIAKKVEAMIPPERKKRIEARKQKGHQARLDYRIR